MTVRNQYLFTQAYLDQVVADPSHDEAAATLGQGLSDWAAFRDDASLSTLIDSWVGPVLDILGFHHQGVEGQPGLERLYSDFTAQELLGLCLTVPPGADIDSTIKGVHYAFQIIAALQEEGCTWGILTDGSLWRLVKADVLRPYETYLEVDLGQMSTRPTAETLRVFHTFFRRDAFLADDDGKTGLDEHLARSDEVAKAIQKHLKDKMESVLGALSRGFVMADGRQSYTEEQRAEIFDNATYLLYRILFILYAEARGLLPVGNPAYDEIGMQRLVQQAVRYHKQGVPDPASTTLWDGLRRLSKAIYESDEARGVPAYNGGLFSDEDTDDFSKGYLYNCFISDPHLTRALFDLTRIANSQAPDGYQPIDYRDLSVRALGGLYEGMLEYKLFLAEQKTYGIPDRKGGFQYKPATQVERPKRTYREIEAGDVYFAHTPTQRKATGSYYTPEDIVDYIVKNTVQQGLRERLEPLQTKLTDWLGEVAGALDDAERTRLQKAVDRALLLFVEREVLTFRVCDPAMGSGHFLVNATHTMANFIVETLNLTPWENARLDSDPALWRRRLVESCIYGVDLNPLAVELAKLSLWLATVGAGKPLNFLDHHFKVGNSLIGARVEEVGSLPVTEKRPRAKEVQVAAQQMSYFDRNLNEILPTMLEKVLDISEVPSEKPEDIRGKEAADQAVEELTAPLKAVADLWVSTYFGNKVSQEDYHEALEHIHDPKQILRFPPIRKALEMAKKRRLFHWELEFPEVFYGDSKRLGNPGFDAIVGNPPYGEVLETDTRRYLEIVLDGRPFSVGTDARVPSNVYAPMFENIASTMKNEGWFGYVIPNSSVCSPRYARIRQLLRNKFKKIYISNFSIRPQPIFPGVMQRVAIVLAKRGNGREPQVYTTRYIRPTAENRPTLFRSIEYSEVSQLAWLREGCIPKLGNHIDVAIYETMTGTGLNIGDLTGLPLQPTTDLYYHDSGESYWTKALAFAPIGVRNGREVPASKWKSISVPSQYGSFAVCLLNSSFFYWYWLTTSDCRDLTKRTVVGCSIPRLQELDKRLALFQQLSDRLMDCYRQNMRMVEKRRGYASPEIAVRNCKDTIDQIDLAVGRAFSFHPEWIQYLIEYDAGCRIAQ